MFYVPWPERRICLLRAPSGNSEGRAGHGIQDSLNLYYVTMDTGEERTQILGMFHRWGAYVDIVLYRPPSKMEVQDLEGTNRG